MKMQHIIRNFNVGWRPSVTETHLTSILGTDATFLETVNKGHKSIQMKDKNVCSRPGNSASQVRPNIWQRFHPVTSIPPHYTHDSINDLISNTHHGHQQHPTK
jgi:hypothetical protein